MVRRKRNIDSARSYQKGSHNTYPIIEIFLNYPQPIVQKPTTCSNKIFIRLNSLFSSDEAIKAYTYHYQLATYTR
ncbi:hypothetical protein D7322_11295 [Sphingobacterium puteale]|uniref:Uncharacterized protein n=1 Tax=Sphingobacterium puteale TaxID=2420510 RepID=A0A420VY61_9SPHI|nr:hypothetical protein D7322_11295 [Sphingobacterium puteale]